MDQTYVAQLMTRHFKQIQGQQDEAMFLNVVAAMGKNKNELKAAKCSKRCVLANHKQFIFNI